MSEYIGTQLTVELTDGSTVTGIVNALDQEKTLMTLSPATICKNGAIQQVGRFNIYGSQIAQLHVHTPAPPPKSPPKQFIDPAIVSMSPVMPRTPLNKPNEVTTPSAPPKIASKSTEKPVEKPVEKHVAKPAEKPVTKSAEKPVAKPTEKPTAKPVEKPTAKPVEKLTTKPAEKPVQKTSKVPFFGQRNAPRHDDLETEVLDYEDLYGPRKGKRFEQKKEAPPKEPATKENTTTKHSSPKESAPKEASTPKQSSPKDSSPKESSPKEAVNQEASATLVSMLNLENTSEKDDAKLGSPFKIPANLIPPKARGISNGKVSPKSSPPGEKASPPSEKNPQKSKTSPPRERASPSKEKSTLLKDKTNQGKASPPKEKAAAPQEKAKAPPVKEKVAKKVKSPKENELEIKDDDDTLPIIKTVVNGARCPVVTVEQMREVEQICVSETGPNEEMMIENAGHGTSVMALKAIGGHRRIQPGNHNAAPVVVVFAGNTKAGSYGLAAARHLANRACQVYVMLAFRKDGVLSDQVEMQKKCAQFAGAQIVETIEELPHQQTTPVDLIIDGLMGSESSVQLLRGDYATRELLWESMDWANANKAPVLSLDFPSGINATSGLPFHVMHYIQPKWTLCFGAPKQGCTSRQITGELFLADIGIPSVSWRRIGISRCKIPWGAEFVVALEYEG